MDAQPAPIDPDKSGRAILRSPWLHAGIAVWLLGAFGWLFLWYADRPQAIATAVALGAFLAAGKIAGISAGLALDGNPLYLAIAIFVPDFGGLLFFHPITYYAVHRVGRMAGKVWAAIENSRRKHPKLEAFIMKYGSWGIFMIALLPVGFYSPLIIAAIGQLFGFRARNILLAVGSAMAIMTAIWVGLLVAGVSGAAKIDPRLPLYLTLALVAFFGIKNLIKLAWRRRSRPVAEATPPPTSQAATGPEDMKDRRSD